MPVALKSHSLISSATEHQRVTSKDQATTREERGSEASLRLVEAQAMTRTEAGLLMRGSLDDRDARSISNSRLRPQSESLLEQARPDHASSREQNAQLLASVAATSKEAWAANQSPVAVDSKVSEQAFVSTFQMSSTNEYLAPLQIKDGSRKGSGVTTVAQGRSLADTRKASLVEQQNLRLGERNRLLEKRLNDLEA